MRPSLTTPFHRHYILLGLTGGRVQLHEQERKARDSSSDSSDATTMPTFLQQRLQPPPPAATADKGSAAVPHLVVYRPTDNFVLTRGASWRLPLAAPTTAAEGWRAGCYPLLDLREAAYVGEDRATVPPQHLFATAPANVDPEYLAAEGATWVPARALLESSPATDAAALALCLSTVSWLTAAPFCSRCGAATAVTDYGHTRTCRACPHVYHPPVSPAVIVAVLDGKGHVLLSERHPPAGRPAPARPMRTILAGFVSQGEAAEETVVREVAEESQAAVTALRYVGSQPWPFPHQLMLCYYAVAPDSPELAPELAELASVAWVSKEEVRRALAGTHEEFVVPPPFTAAHRLLTDWVEGKVDDQGEPCGKL
uniref:NAD(+) diphosphatase n=1 Tax=Strigomonas galati TaxID=1003336 RepID=T1YSN8_9TRYP|nr:NAD+ diphosphatase [Strigomonas galati]